jgi:hypothetical protein
MAKLPKDVSEVKRDGVRIRLFPPHIEAVGPDAIALLGRPIVLLPLIAAMVAITGVVVFFAATHAPQLLAHFPTKLF